MNAVHQVVHQSADELVCACGKLLSNRGTTRSLLSLFAQHIREEKSA